MPKTAKAIKYTCMSCVHFDESPNNVAIGGCHINPPHVGEDGYGIFPIMYGGDDWCAELTEEEEE